MTQKILKVKGKTIKLPTFFPDATRGVIKSLDSKDLRDAMVEGVVVNTYHLMHIPGSHLIQQAQGINKLMNWKGHTISDSGGFQMLSLIHKNKDFGTITDKGIHLTTPGFKKQLFTPEKCIQTQFEIGADIFICLDDCPAINANEAATKDAVERTIKWAKRCKDEFDREINFRKLSTNKRPILFAVVQGGRYAYLRKKCAKALVDIGFDGYAFGGWPILDGKLDVKALKLVAEYTPKDAPKYALGVGRPEEVAQCIAMGYSIFDCVLPTRDARHERLYVFNKDPKKIKDFTKDDFYEFLNINKDMYLTDYSPLCKHCECFSCKNYSRAYITHLFKIKDSLAHRLCTIHNLYMYSTVIRRLRNLTV